MGENVRALV